jgi:murein DD-endopeptidase MepM/ murein hydrolase activator NlpD
MLLSSRSKLTLLVFAAAIALWPTFARCSEPAGISVTIAPEQLANGSPCLLTVHMDSAARSVSGNLQGHTVVFFSSSDRRTWFSLAGIDVETAPGKYPLTVEATLDDGTSRTFHDDLNIEEAPYEKVPLSVPDKFVEPNAAALKKIAADKILKDKAFAASDSKPQWTGNFVSPLHQAPQSDSFGNQRLFNGKLASVHRGLDYHAKSGTPVAAVNSGRVVLAQPLYYEGGCVVIDHGLGLMSVYMHLSKIQVAVGRRVRRGQTIALSGATGRATGPHLHLGIRWQGSYLDPAKLFQIQLPQPQQASTKAR